MIGFKKLNLLIQVINLYLVGNQFVQSASNVTVISLQSTSSPLKLIVNNLTASINENQPSDKQISDKLQQLADERNHQQKVTTPTTKQQQFKSTIDNKLLQLDDNQDDDEFRLPSMDIVIKNKFDDREWSPKSVGKIKKPIDDWGKSVDGNWKSLIDKDPWKTIKLTDWDDDWKKKKQLTDNWRKQLRDSWKKSTSSYRYNKNRNNHRNRNKHPDSALKWSRPDLFNSLETKSPPLPPTGLYHARPVQFKKIKSNGWKSYPTKDYESLRRLIRTKYMPIYWKYWKSRGRRYGRRPRRYRSFKRRYTSSDDIRTLLWLEFLEPSMGQWKFWHLFGSGIDAFWPMYYDHDIEDDDDDDIDDDSYFW